jgi:hypothetical protein
MVAKRYYLHVFDLNTAQLTDSLFLLMKIADTDVLYTYARAHPLTHSHTVSYMQG